MKIGIVCYPSIGGSGIVASELGKGLMGRGHEIHFFSYDLPHRLDGSEKEFIFHHVDVPLYPVFRFPPYTLALATRIAQAAEERHLDLVHVHYAIPHSTSALLARLMTCYYNHKPLRVITTLHGTDIDLVGREPTYRPVVEFSINSSDAVTAVSGYLRDATLETFEVRRDIRVIYNPIDTDLFHPAERKDSSRKKEKTILHISNFRPVKRVTDAVKILDVLRHHFTVRLVFIGEGPDRPMAERTVKQFGVSDRVSFEGKEADIASWLRKADLLLSTSELESFGMTIAEAMASGVPVVAYRVGGVPEVVEDGVHGRLVEMGDICGAARAITEILGDPDRTRSYGAAARRKVETVFRLDKIAEQYESLYSEILEQAPFRLKDVSADCF